MVTETQGHVLSLVIRRPCKVRTEYGVWSTEYADEDVQTSLQSGMSGMLAWLGWLRPQVAYAAELLQGYIKDGQDGKYE